MFTFKNGQTQTQKEQKTTKLKIELSGHSSKMTISSLEIARITDRRHKDVLRSIRQMEPSWEETIGRKFALNEYTDVIGRKLPKYDFDKLEYMYVISKFDDEIRARLILRWYELEIAEQKRKKKGVKLLDHELPLFDILNRYLVKGCIKAVAQELGYHRSTVSRVKRGIFRNKEIMKALLAKCRYNKENGLSEDYTKKMVQLELGFFTNAKTLAQ